MNEGAPHNRAARRTRRQVDGLLLLDKPPGLSSNHALQRVKRLFRAAKAGHTGSLDPLASGMLPICLGQATKVSAFLLDAAKEYLVTMCVGRKTSTGDAEGEVIAESPVRELSAERIESALAAFRGRIEQVPPMYSALHHQGRRLYELARAGVEVPREPRTVQIHELLLENAGGAGPVLRIRCSKGTYIRTLVEDIAQACGTVGHVTALRRIAVGPFGPGLMLELERLQALAVSEGPLALDGLLRPADEALADWPGLHLGASQAYYLLRGQPVAVSAGQARGQVRLYGDSGRFLGIGELLGDGRVAPRRLFVRGSTAGAGGG